MTYGQQLIQKGMREGIQQGIEQGMQQGAQQEKEILVKKMLLKGRPMKEIADLTDLPLSKIKLIQQALLH